MSLHTKVQQLELNMQCLDVLEWICLDHGQLAQFILRVSVRDISRIWRTGATLCALQALLSPSVICNSPGF